MSKYVFFDIDGTLWDESAKITESTKNAIRALRENGHKALICTGRARGNVCDPQFEEIGFDGIIAACGNHVEMQGEILYERILPFETVQKIYDVTHKYHMPIVLEGPQYQWLDENGFEGDSYITYMVEELKEAAIPLRECNEAIRINKFSALVSPKTDYEAIKKLLGEEFDFLEHGGGVIEAVPKGTSKATGIEWLCNHFHIAKEDTYAIGDSVNDLDMLRFAGHGIAMGNGMDVAKEAAEFVTKDIKKDGIFHALKHYGLI
uniref:Cof-type HAD-IIB family hydrolase n=1 Tax=Agathobacter sp. TaxID=2021311 RepID=UPI004057907A